MKRTQKIPARKTVKRDSLMLRARCKPNLKSRVLRLAKHRECDEADVIREAVVRHLETEETRLGINAA